jgi:hypothetical protein
MRIKRISSDSVRGPGYALIEVDADRAVDRIELAFFDIDRDAYLWSAPDRNATWRKEAYYFECRRDSDRSVFVIGPEVCNHLSPDTLLEISSGDGAVEHQQQVWEGVPTLGRPQSTSSSAVTEPTPRRGGPSVSAEPASTILPPSAQAKSEKKESAASAKPVSVYPPRSEQLEKEAGAYSDNGTDGTRKSAQLAALVETIEPAKRDNAPSGAVPSEDLGAARRKRVMAAAAIGYLVLVSAATTASVVKLLNWSRDDETEEIFSRYPIDWLAEGYGSQLVVGQLEGPFVPGDGFQLDRVPPVFVGNQGGPFEPDALRLNIHARGETHWRISGIYGFWVSPDNMMKFLKYNGSTEIVLRLTSLAAKMPVGTHQTEIVIRGATDFHRRIVTLKILPKGAARF